MPLRALKPPIRATVAPLLTFPMFGTPLDALFTRSPILTSRSGLTLHPLRTVLRLTALAPSWFTVSAVSSMAAALSISRRSLWLFAVRK